MALQSVYEHFLAAPNPLNLTEDAALHYVTTLISHSQSGPIIRHLEKQNTSVVKIKAAKVIGSVEGPTSLAAEIETTLEFISGGGDYLPGLENFVIDRVVTLPLTHMVIFDQGNKIKQIRISWDQGSLLKQVDVIGSRGKNWPIVDGNDQIRLIANSEKINTVSKAADPTSARGRDAQENGIGARNPSPNKKHIKDPYASLDLFKPMENDENQSRNYTSAGSSIAPRMSAKPPPREMSELFAAGHEDFEPSKQNGSSPKKNYNTMVAPKAGGGHRYQPSRLFDEESDTVNPSPYKAHPTKYNHFELGEEAENDPLQYKDGNGKQSTQVPLRPKTNKHMSQWDFQDFTTPSKPNPKVRGQDVVHFGWGDDEPENANTGQATNAASKSRRDADSHFEIEDDGTPVNREATVPKPRKDAQTHFEFGDDSPEAPRRIIGRPAAAASGLYQNNIYSEDEEEGDTSKDKTPLATITNNTGRKNDFGSHWQMTDSSPAPEKTKSEKKTFGDDRKKAIQMMNAQWGSYDESPEQSKRPASKGLLRKGTESNWSHGDEEQDLAKPNSGAPAKNYWDF